MTDPVDRRVRDIGAYEEQAGSGRCFVCQIVDGTHEFPHGEVWRDDRDGGEAATLAPHAG